MHNDKEVYLQKLNDILIKNYINESWLNAHSFDKMNYSGRKEFIEKLPNLVDIDSILSQANIPDDLTDELREELEQPYIYELIGDDLFTKYDNNQVKDYVDYLSNMDDKIGDTQDISLPDIDVYTRDKAFICTPEQLIIGDKGETHGQLCNQLGDYNKYQRPSNNKLNDLGIEEYCFGNIINNIAFIDPEYQTMDISIVCSKLKDKNISKVYSLPYGGNKVTRLAKRIMC